jgi:hypothetical protein
MTWITSNTVQTRQRRRLPRRRAWEPGPLTEPYWDYIRCRVFDIRTGCVIES